jgi:hypothetical protein
MHTDEYHFDRSKLFYPFIIQYITALHGLNDLLTRGVINLAKDSYDDYGKLLKDLEQNNLGPKLKEILASDNRSLLFDIKLYSKSVKKYIEFDINEISKDLITNINYLAKYQVVSANSLLISTYEISKKYEIKNDVWNFFYHCRNAAAHDGKLNITKIKRFPAKWEGLEILPSDNGKDLFGSLDRDGLLFIGDPIRLLWHIEVGYIK